MNSSVRKLIKNLPSKPGAYIFKDKGGRIIYIGKAINIKKRVLQHFSKKTAFYGVSFVKNISAIDHIRSGNESEAMILEDQLIKKYQPRFNIQWRDDKSYFWVGFTNEKWTRVKIVHKGEAVSGKFPVVGPFTIGRELKQVLRALRRIFPYRTCKNPYEKPCLQWHLGLCPAHGAESDKSLVISDKLERYTKSLNALISSLTLK